MKNSLRDLMRSGNYSTTRLDAFSDGVFAIVITLLVLELRVPEVDGPHLSRELVQGLKALLPKFVSFVVSFIYVAIYWVNHHQLFHSLKKADRGLFWLNNLFLMCLTFIPFPTALIGSYPREPVTVIFYGAAMMATAVTFILMKVYIFRGGRLVDLTQIKRPALFYLVAGPGLYLVAVVLAMVKTELAIAIYILIPVIYFFSGDPEGY
jgi:uncharacterized membrane protein